MAHALKFHTTPFHSSQVDTIHRQKMMESLTSRLNVARSAHNIQLIEVLEQEKRQIERNTTGQRGMPFAEAWLTSLQGMRRVFWRGTAQTVSEFSCGSDRWWYTFDPNTDECIYADSEIELRIWIQENVH